MELIKNSMLKLWLEDFYNFCQKVGGDTAVIMGEILMARADRVAINITLNSFGTPLNEVRIARTGLVHLLGIWQMTNLCVVFMRL